MKNTMKICFMLAVIFLIAPETVSAKSGAKKLNCTLAPTVVLRMDDVRFAVDHMDQGLLPGAVLTAAIAMQEMGYSTGDIWEAYHCAIGDNTVNDCWYKDFGWVIENFREFSQAHCGYGAYTTAVPSTPMPTEEPTEEPTAEPTEEPNPALAKKKSK